MLHTQALHGRPYDGHTLNSATLKMVGITGVEPQRIYVDRGYCGHDYPNKHRVYRSGQKRGVFGTIKKELRRRSVIEPVIGHLKSDGRLGRNYLESTLGDQQNALLTDVGYNFRLLLKWLKRLFWCRILDSLIAKKVIQSIGNFPQFVKLYFYNPQLTSNASF